ncbi:MAG: hypothetical protein JNK16_02700 [Phycisphaerales bacterium]|nr:hypothetical protein [Phycisphaerales bacterium]
MHHLLMTILVLCSMAVGSLRLHASEVARAEPVDPVPEQPGSPKDYGADEKDVPRLLAPQNAVLALKRWHDAALCSSCKGSGKAVKKVTTGNKSGDPNPAGPRIIQPITKDVTVDCPTCDGEKLTKEPRLVAAGNTFAKTLSQIDTADERWPAAHDDLLTKLRELVDLGKAAWESRLNKTIGVLLTGTVQKTAQPIVFLGFLDQERQKNETDKRVLWVSVGDTSVRFERPRAVDVTGDGKFLPIKVLCGGWLVRREDDGGRFESVIGGGFLMSVR